MTQPYHLLPRLGSSLAEEWQDIGLNHHVAGRYPQAKEAYDKGLRIDPNNGPIIANLAIMAAQQGQMITALQYLERALLFDSENATTWHNYALALLEAERADEALPAISRSLKIMESADALCAKGMILTSLARAAEAVEFYDAALVKNPVHQMASYNTLFVRTLKNTTPADNHEARKRWYEANGYKGERKAHDNDKTPDRPLRIGYVGGDFKMHSAAFLFGTVVLEHSNACEAYCYMTLASSAEDTRTKAYMDKTVWRDISAKSDDEAEAMIRADKIDILVDLAGHTGGNRLPLFTRKPAPIQCHAWGFAHGTGCPEVDYFLADDYAVPQAERQHFTETVWDLPAVVGYTPLDYGASGVSAAPVTRDGVFTFGVFGRFEKYSPQAMEAWHKILLRVPDSRLRIKDLVLRRPYAIKRLREVMHDIDPKRILFMEACSHPEQMLAYQGVDLVLDTFPHTGGVTALEMLYMGVPVVTLYNGQVGGRTTAVALRAMNRQNWIADSIDQYVSKAVKLASERTEISAARAKLRDELLKSPLCDGYALSVENAFRGMWHKFCGVSDEAQVPRPRRVYG